MGGGLLQLVTIGAQDVFISGDPQITFFKLVYKRHTNFALESKLQTSSKAITGGARTDIDIKREGDLINHMFLRIKNPTKDTAGFCETLGRTFITNVINQNIYVDNALNFRKNMDIMITAGSYSATASSIPISTYRTSIIDVDYDLNILTITGKYPITLEPHTFIGAKSSTYIFNEGFIVNPVSTATIEGGTKLPFQVLEIKGHTNDTTNTWKECTDTFSNTISGVRGVSGDMYQTFGFSSNSTISGVTSASGYVSSTGVPTNSYLPYDMIFPTSHVAGVSAAWDTSTTGKKGACCQDNVDGYNLISKIELLIGGNVIDTMYGDLLNIWNELTISNGNKEQFNSMTSTEHGKYCYLPLYFWFNKSPGLALPLIALQYHTVTVRITWNDNIKLDTNASPDLYVDYIFLDSGERRRFAQSTHQYLVELWQRSPDTLESNDNNKNIQLIFNHPVKELLWRAKRRNDTYISWENITLKFNGSARLEERHGEYFQQVQPFYHHSAIPKKSQGIHCYSFAIKPEEHQPSGSCNFSRLDNVTLQLNNIINYEGDPVGVLKQFNGSNDSIKLNVYALTYNVLNIMSGMGALAFAN